MKKYIVFIISFFIVFTAIQFISGMILTFTYIPDIEGLWSGSTNLGNEVQLKKTSYLPTLIIVLLSAGISYLITKFFINKRSM